MTGCTAHPSCMHASTSAGCQTKTETPQSTGAGQPQTTRRQVFTRDGMPRGSILDNWIVNPDLSHDGQQWHPDPVLCSLKTCATHHAQRGSSVLCPTRLLGAELHPASPSMRDSIQVDKPVSVHPTSTASSGHTTEPQLAIWVTLLPAKVSTQPGACKFHRRVLRPAPDPHAAYHAMSGTAACTGGLHVDRQ